MVRGVNANKNGNGTSFRSVKIKEKQYDYLREICELRNYRFIYEALDEVLEVYFDLKIFAERLGVDVKELLNIIEKEFVPKRILFRKAEEFLKFLELHIGEEAVSKLRVSILDTIAKSKIKR